MISGTTGAGVTNQSGRANAFKKADQASSRYQGANGSVLFYNEAGQGRDGARAGGLAAPGNYRYTLSTGNGGGAGGFAGRSPVAHSAGGAFANDAALLIKEQLADAGNAITVQAVNDRTFYLQADNVWQDHSFDPKKQTVTKIQAFSEAHFALLRAMPTLAAYSSVGDEVVVRIGNNAVQIGKAGKETLTAAELKALTGK